MLGTAAEHNTGRIAEAHLKLAEESFYFATIHFRGQVANKQCSVGWVIRILIAPVLLAEWFKPAITGAGGTAPVISHIQIFLSKLGSQTVLVVESASGNKEANLAKVRLRGVYLTGITENKARLQREYGKSCTALYVNPWLQRVAFGTLEGNPCRMPQHNTSLLLQIHHSRHLNRCRMERILRVHSNAHNL